MQITVEYTAQLKRAAGVPAETFELDDDGALDDLVQQIVRRHGNPLRSVLLGEDGRLHPSILVFVGERQLHADDGSLGDGDVVSFLSPISGG